MNPPAGAPASRARPLAGPVIGVAVALAAALLLRGAPEPAPRVEHQVMMDTVVTITAFPTPGVDLDQVLDRAFARMRELEPVFSAHQEDSALVRLSRAGTAPTTALPPELASLMAEAVRLRAATGGLFEPTIGRVVDLWGFGPSGPVTLPPDPTLLEEARSALAAPVVTQDRITLPPGTWLDLGGLAKGFAVDEAVRILAQAGVAGLVDAGGDLACTGPKPGDRDWRVGIRDPRAPDRILGVVPLRSGAVVTSGDYERFFESGGVRYHHLIDPRTGQPGRHHVSATVRAPTAREADAWSTATFLMGPSRPSEWPLPPGIEVLVIRSDGLREATREFPLEATE